MARRRRVVRSPGLLPRIGIWIWGALRWCLRRPQLVVVPGILLASVLAFWGFAARSEAFRVTDIRLPEGSSFKLSQPLIGENLWDIDLASLARSLKAQQPQLKQVRALRRLPNAVEIEVVERVPLAQVRIAQVWHALDDEGFILTTALTDPQQDLVTIKAAEDSKAPLKPGQISANQRLLAALRFITRLKRSGVLAGHRISAVDVRDLKQVNALVDGEIELRFGGEEEWAGQLDRLRGAWKVVTKNPSAVRYVDIRFADPVIGPRT